MLITLVIFSAALALLFSFVISNKASKLGFAVAVRFLERGNVIPPGGLPLNIEQFDRWRSAPENRASVQGYASEIMFWDMAFLTSFGIFFGLSSAALAGQGGMSFWQVYWILPLLYIASDFTEDVLIRRLLLSNSRPAGDFALMRLMTTAKIAASTACFLQVFILAGYAIWKGLS